MKVRKPKREVEQEEIEPPPPTSTSSLQAALSSFETAAFSPEVVASAQMQRQVLNGIDAHMRMHMRLLEEAASCFAIVHMRSGGRAPWCSLCKMIRRQRAAEESLE